MATAHASGVDDLAHTRWYGLLALGISAVVAAVVLGIAIWVQAGLIQYRAVDIMHMKVSAGEIIIESPNDSAPHHLVESVVSDILGASIGSLVVIGMLQTLIHASIGASIAWYWWRIRRSSRCSARSGELT